MKNAPAKGGVTEMRNRQDWQPTKFVRAGTSLRASRDPVQVGVGSRLMADCVAEAYDLNLPIFARGRLLDLGCGEVPLYGAYKDYVTDVVCVDWDETIHSGARRHVDVEANLCLPLPFKDSVFDTILCSDVLEHIPTPDPLWREISRLLRPGGKLLLNVPFCYWIHERPHDYLRLTEYALRRLAFESGLEVVHLSALGGVVHILTDIVAKQLTRVRIAGKPMASAIQKVVGAVARTSRGRRIAQRMGKDFPFGYFVVAAKPGPESAA